ncbi:hypothetical protein [Nostoc sp. UHCC 0252]|uniref:hypothetical protein n=1 Tax=Nostoc sp. UHCC 0252 TaxID=3110241 RepID=UPI002B21C0C2|nr:hypothetical protein [Nostoc sp. UHCC 0252]MEA5605479.1 hypothetical protein [Nostoc sp. UHCC 0252]
MDEQTQELDLGLETSITPPTPEIDYEAALAQTKPDFQRMVKLLGIKPTGSSQEEVVADLLAKQQALEAELRENLVPKIQTALQAVLAKSPNTNGNSVVTKPGVSVNKTSTEEDRKVKAWRGY